MNIADNTKKIRASIPESVELVAVSKTKSNEEIMQAYDVGQRVFGENKVQDMTAKNESLPKDIRWHMIGHVQTNKVKYMAPYVDLIHGVDSFKLLKEINKQAAKNERIISCLLQIHIAEEATKFGLSPDQCKEVVIQAEALENITIKGLMGMATFTDNVSQIEREFKSLKELFEDLKSDNKDFDILSMGMSGDYELAIKEGSTMIRVGSKIFGERNY
ncbi:YggS family pyridoxal phosphate-dependent enzyme [Flavobacteriaceae bacterium]|nr:YggS family pyridoxal phosphate-dependent enzyme [Flavobacteriaceae bacterium]